MLCSKGLNLHYTANDKTDRLLYPQMRYNKSMPMQRVSWDDALERTAAIFKTFINKYGPIRWRFMHRANALPRSIML
jgi:ferredoxin-nitrate reductase